MDLLYTETFEVSLYFLSCAALLFPWSPHTHTHTTYTAHTLTHDTLQGVERVCRVMETTNCGTTTASWMRVAYTDMLNNA